MKILVAIKPVADPYMRIRVKADGTGLENSNVKIVTNPFDEIALEEAIRIKEAAPAGAHTLTVVSIGTNTCQEVLRLGLALGADEAIHIISEQTLFPLDVAKILQAVVLRNTPDIVLAGKQAVDNDNNQTGQMLAGLLGWPQGTFASKIQFENDRVLVTREVDGGLETLELTLPAVITTDLRLNTPRYANLANLMKARQKTIQTYTLAELGINVDENAIKMISMHAPQKRQAGVKVASVEELVEKLKNEKRIF